MTRLAVTTSSYVAFLKEAATAAHCRALRARNPTNKKTATAMADLLTAAAVVQPSYDGVYRVAVPISDVVCLAEVILGREAPTVEREAS